MLTPEAALTIPADTGNRAIECLLRSALEATRDGSPAHVIVTSNAWREITRVAVNTDVLVAVVFTIDDWRAMLDGLKRCCERGSW